MGLTVFNQFPQLTRLLARIARTAAHKETARPFARINLSGGRGSLTDRAVNSKLRRKRPSPSRAAKLNTHLVKMKDGVGGTPAGLIVFARV